MRWCELFAAADVTMNVDAEIAQHIRNIAEGIGSHKHGIHWTSLLGEFLEMMIIVII
ncbi:hypothetical protein JOS77_23800 [Chromobacterium haemolyticum]|nr:hypothetical protein JOS77_23800 [Chromobacterium haemolyticum]